jgi:putative intracellular protease/amidase
MKILMVLTSHDRLGDTGKKTGIWLEEFAAPYYVFKDAGAEITVASPLAAANTPRQLIGSPMTLSMAS